MIFAFIKEHQLNIMLILCAICATMAILLLLTRFLDKKRKWILFLMELLAALLIGFDRAAYIYKGDISQTGYIMVRVSNFMIFFLTSAIVLGFNLYLIDLLLKEGKINHIPKRLKVVNIGASVGMALVIVSQFTGLYYSIDEQNQYHRGDGFLICYIVPVLFPIIQYTTIHQYKKAFSRLIYLSLVLYIFVPITAGVIQIFAYGISIVNMAIVMVSVFLYIFSYLNINDEVKKAHETEVNTLQREQKSMKRLFDQTVTAFVTAIEKRDVLSEGHSVRVAGLARKIAECAGKSQEDCEEVYYTALLHDVGMMGLPDSVILKTENFTKEELAQKRQKPVLGAEILSSITEYPYLSQGVRYTRERYDGTGYPDGLKGEEIPEFSRIIAVADAYDTMTSRKNQHISRSYQAVREEFIKYSGSQFDPAFSDIMIQLMDIAHAKESQAITQTETELLCGTYRENVSAGIPVVQEFTKISFSCSRTADSPGTFSAPSVIVFDAYDQHIHDNEKAIEAYHYMEYGEIWFDGHYVSTSARNMEVHVTETRETAKQNEIQNYEIIAGRFEDHLSVRLISPVHTAEAVIALPDNSKDAYISLTGENCHITNIAVQKMNILITAGEIKKIVSPVSYIERLESDLPNVQIDHNCSAFTEGIPVLKELRIDFHTMSLPSAELVWHCPYLVLFYSADKKPHGKYYHEYALIKLNGESTDEKPYAENQFHMKKNTAFLGWENWKKKHKDGLECSVQIIKKGNKIITKTETLGIAIENTTIIHDGTEKIYAALTGNRVALTDIRIR